MIETLTLQNVRCFRVATVRLGPLTAIVGPNASGKTTLLRKIAVAWSLVGGDEREHRPDATVRVRWESDGKSGELLKAGPRLNTTVMSTAPWRGLYLHLDPAQMREARGLSEARSLDQGGGNLVNVFASIARPQQQRTADDLRRLVPTIGDVHPAPLRAGEHRLRFQDRWNDQVWYEPQEISDGTFLTLALLTLAHQLDRVDVVAIEEPERGLHPFLLEQIVAMLRELSTGAIGGRPMQVVLATQSPTLLAYLDPSEVRFLNRDPKDGSVTIEQAPTDTPDWQASFDTYQRSFGDMWLSGSLGGVPTG